MMEIPADECFIVVFVSLVVFLQGLFDGVQTERLLILGVFFQHMVELIECFFSYDSLTKACSGCIDYPVDQQSA